MEATQNDRRLVLTRYLAEVRECPLPTREEQEKQQHEQNDPQGGHDRIAPHLHQQVSQELREWVTGALRERCRHGLPYTEATPHGALGNGANAGKDAASKRRGS